MVEWKKLGEVCKVHTGSQLNRSDMLDNGLYPVVNGGRDYSGYTDKYNEDANTITISQGGESAGFVNWINVKFWAGAHCYVVEDTDSFDKRFLYHVLKNKEREIQISKQGAGIPGLTRDTLYKQVIAIPSLSEQQRIVSILDTFTSSIANLKQQIEERRKQYEYERDRLLDLEGEEGVEMKKLGDVCDTLSGFPFDSSLFKDNGIQLMRGANVKRGFFDFNEDLNKYWESSEGLDKYLLEANDIIISMDGSLVGRSFCYLKKEYLPLLLVQRVARIRTSENFKYIYYNITKSFPDYVDSKKTAGAIPHISMKDINNFPIPLPSLEEQSRIVSILDTFEASIKNLEEQLALREKQYEYYRNKLLTFE